MTHKERFLNALAHKPVDRLAYFDGPWGETLSKWIAQGHLVKDEDLCDHFDMSLRSGGWLNGVSDLDFEPVVIEETEETILKLDGNGAKLRHWKEKAGTPEHVDFTVKDRVGWEKHTKSHLIELDRRRIPFETYRDSKKLAAEEERAFSWAGVAPFEQIHPVCGHEYMLMGMALDPDWVKDMVTTFADFTIRHLEVLFAEEGAPDFMFFFEDMGYKGKPFMSPTMYADIMQPAHKKLFDYSHDLGLKVMVHSCGYVADFVPGLIEAGMDCLQAMEVKAGMDMPKLCELHGDKISFCGGVDIRVVETNDYAKIDKELNRKIIPVLKHPTGYILHSDHSIPHDVEYETLKYFFERGSSITERI